MKRVLALAVLALAVPTAALAGPASSPASPPARGGVVVDRVVSVVNGVPVFDSDVVERATQIERAAAAAKPGAGATKAIDKADARRRAVTSLMQEALMVAAARELGVGVTTGEIDQAVATIKQQNRLDDDALVAALAGEQLTLAGYREGVERKLLLMKTQQALVRGAELVREPELRAAYEKAKAGGATGTFEAERPRLYGELYQAELMRVMQRWLEEQQKHAFIEARGP